MTEIIKRMTGGLRRTTNDAMFLLCFLFVSLMLLPACVASKQPISKRVSEYKIDPAKVADAVSELAAFEQINQDCGQLHVAHENKKVEALKRVNPSIIVVPSTHPDGFAKSCIVAGVETLQNAPPKLCDLSPPAVRAAMAFAVEVARVRPEILQREFAQKLRNDCGRASKVNSALSNSKLKNLCIENHSVLAAAIASRRNRYPDRPQTRDHSVENLITACSLSSLLSDQRDRCLEFNLAKNFPDRARRSGISGARLYGIYAEPLICESLGFPYSIFDGQP